ncbi:GNAT family N-acetyltransferase [Agarivorans sp. MS3-6]
MMSAAKIRWQTLETLDELFSLEQQWNQLALTCSASLFSQCRWVKQWAEQFWHSGCCLSCLAGFDGETLVALAPFYSQVEGRGLKLQRLSVLAQGEEERAELASEYPDILVDPLYKGIAQPVILAWFTQLKVDVFYCRALKQSSLLYEILANQPKLIVNSARGYSLGSEGWSINQLSRNGRSQWRRADKALKQQNAEFKWLNSDEINLQWPALIAFHQIRWKQKGKAGAFADSRFIAFHEQFAQGCPENVAMSGVFIAGKAIALNYYLLDQNNLYFYQSGWDEHTYSRYSPGFALHVWSIINNPVTRYDFMMGAQSASYKAKFSCDESAMANFSLIKSPWRTRLFKLVNKIL